MGLGSRMSKVAKKPKQELDVNAVAEAVISAINKKISTSPAQVNIPVADGFDSTKSLEKLADAMTVQRGNNESNFNDLGKVKETKKDKDDTDKTIDLLSNLDD